MQIKIPELEPKKENVGDDTLMLTDLAGARYRPPEDGSNDPELYVLVPGDKAERIIDEQDRELREMHVFASTEERVLSTLQKRYPCPDGGTYLFRVKDFTVHKATYEKRRYGGQKRYWTEKKIANAYLRLKHPLFDHFDLDDPEKSLTELRELSERLGPVWLTGRTFNALLGDTRQAEAEGFVTHTPEKHPLWRVNYNPQAFELRDYRERMKEYESRTAPEFPQDHVNKLVRILSPSNWPGMNDGIDDVTFTVKRGWGHEKDIDFKPRVVNNLIAVSRKLFPGNAWWRDKTAKRRYYDGGTAYKELIEKMVRHVHGVRAAHDDEVRKQQEASRYDFEKYCKMYDADPSQWEGRPKLDFEEYAGARNREMFRAYPTFALLRFVVAEARALKVKLPPKPVRPLTPAAEEKLKKAKGRRRRGKAKDAGRVSADAPQA